MSPHEAASQMPCQSERARSTETLQATVGQLDQAVGKKYFQALTNSTWVHRQVDSLRFTESGDTRRHVSLDITVSPNLPTWPPTKAKSGANFFQKRSGSKNAPKQYYAIPLGYLEKDSIQRLDVSLNGTPLPVLTSRENGESAILFLWHQIRQIEAMDSGLDEGSLRALRSLAAEAVMYSGKSDPGSTRERPDVREEIQSIINGSTISNPVLSKIALLLTYLELLVDNFMLIALAPLELRGQRAVVKYSLDQPPASLPKMRILNYWKPLAVEYSPPSFSSNSSYHFEADLPDALRALRVERDGIILGEIKSGSRVHVAWPATLSASINGVTSSDRSVRITTTPAHQGVRTFSFAATIATSIIFTLALFQMLTGAIVRDDFNVPTPAASIVLAGQALLLSWIARNPEHDVVSRALRVLRLSLIVNAGLLFSAALLLAIPVEQWIWKVSWLALFGLSLAVTAARITWGHLNRPSRRAARMSGQSDKINEQRHGEESSDDEVAQQAPQPASVQQLDRRR